MKRKIGSSGGSFIVTLPPRFVEELGLEAGDSVAVIMRGSEVIIRHLDEPNRLASVPTRELEKELARRGIRR